MNKFMNFVKDGESKQLPPGFRFQPTDEEIVFQYLARKTFSHPLPASIIPEIDVFSFVPWELPGDSDQDRYFFCIGEKKMMNSHSRNLNRSSARETCGGYWKSTDSSYKQIVSSKRIPIVGIKKTLVFYKGKHPRASKTDWFVNVYFIALSTNNVNNASSASNYMQHKRNRDQGSLVRIGNWMLCHVFSKKMMTKSSPSVCDSVRVRNYDPKIESDLSDGAYYSSSSSSVSSLSSCCSSSDCSDLSEVSSDSVK